MTKLCLTLAALCYVALIALAIRPGFDLEAAALFYGGAGHFIGDTQLATVVRFVFWAFPFVLYVAMCASALLARFGLVAPRLAPTGRSLLFLTLSLGIGWGVLVQGVFKHVAHRPRPYSVAEFGGPDRFRPFIRFDGACMDSCSFPSSETGSATWVLAPASLVPPPWQGPALAAAIVYAATTGLLRMAFGGHFLSDVIAAALFVILAILAARTVLPRRER